MSQCANDLTITSFLTAPRLLHRLQHFNQNVADTIINFHILAHFTFLYFDSGLSVSFTTNGGAGGDDDDDDE